MDCVFTKFGVDSCSRFPFRVRTHRPTVTHTQVTDATDHPTHGLATDSVGDDSNIAPMALANISRYIEPVWEHFISSSSFIEYLIATTTTEYSKNGSI